MIRDFVNHGTHDPEEYPFLEELHALRRLLATLFAMRNWEDIRVFWLSLVLKIRFLLSRNIPLKFAREYSNMDMNRAESRAVPSLHTWQMRDFLLITQVDAQNIEDCFEILQVDFPGDMSYFRKLSPIVTQLA